MDHPNEIGRYRVIRQLGQGAFADVYLAEDPVQGGSVAIKLARPDVGDIRDRFVDEARLLSRIGSPYTNRVFDNGLYEGRAYLVSEFIEGGSLANTLDHVGRIPLESGLLVIRGLAEGLAVAHRNGLIHRDIKPANILLRGGNYASPVLIDFGVAGFLEPGSHLTQSGQIFGTAYYMSPEQLLGKPQSVASDIYGLGIVLFQMLFGIRPFEADRDFDVFRKVLEGSLTFPDFPTVPGSVQDLIRQCLDKDPTRRPQSADDFLRIIDAVTREVPRSEGPTTLLSPQLPAQSASARNVRLYGWLSSQPSPAATHSSGWRPWATGATLGILLGIGLLYLAWLIHFPAPKTSAHPNPGPPPISMPVPPARPATSVAKILTLTGIVVALAAFPLGLALGKWLSKRRSGIEEEATRLLFGARSRQKLTETLAIEVETLVLQLDRLDERIVGLSIAIMVDEFRRAKKPELRQKALLQMMELMEKIRYRLTPWYVRHDKLIAIVVSVLTCLSGIATAIANITRPAHP